MAYTPRGGRPQGRGGFSPRGGVSKVSCGLDGRHPDNFESTRPPSSFPQSYLGLVLGPIADRNATCSSLTSNVFFSSTNYPIIDSVHSVASRSSAPQEEGEDSEDVGDSEGRPAAGEAGSGGPPAADAAVGAGAVVDAVVAEEE